MCIRDRLYLCDSDGTHEPVRVTFTDGFDGLPVFSPDGTKLAWTSNRTPQKTSQIFMADWNHAEALAALEKAPERKSEGAKLSAEIRETDLRSHVSFLASEELEGRRTGSE